MQVGAHCSFTHVGTKYESTYRNCLDVISKTTCFHDFIHWVVKFNSFQRFSFLFSVARNLPISIMNSAPVPTARKSSLILKAPLALCWTTWRDFMRTMRSWRKCSTGIVKFTQISIGILSQFDRIELESSKGPTSYPQLIILAFRGPWDRNGIQLTVLEGLRFLNTLDIEKQCLGSNVKVYSRLFIMCGWTWHAKTFCLRRP